ncbi:MAG: serine hydrolase [Rubrivivax sp.]|nr:serine hydrolase [Rubrivivax sp.]
MPTPDHQLNQAALDQAIALAQANETSWTRDPQREPLRFGVHHDDPPPWNQLRGPVHARGPVSGVVWQQGREIAAWGEPARSDQTFSVAKTCLALLAGVAQRRGLLPNVDHAVAAQLPGIGFDSPHNATITWRQLLEQTSEWEGSSFGLPDQVDRWRKVSHDPRPAGGPKGGARPLQAPGSYWEYNDVRINQLALALLHLFRQPLQDVMRDELLHPLGAQDEFRWQGYDDAWVTLDGRRLPTVPGGTHWGGGISISARDQARLGQLLLDDGMHQGQALLPPGWVRQMATPCTIAPFYGWLVWLNPEGRLFRGASPQALFMQGAGGHMVWVDPGLKAVVVTRWLDPAVHADFIERMATALRSPGQTDD